MTQALTVIDEIRSTLTRMSPQFAMALPKHVTPDRFVRVVMTAVQNVPALMEVDRQSLYSACMKAAQMGLLPDGREGAIVPRKSHAAWMPMVAGLQKLVRNSGDIGAWSVQIVRENDEFDYELGDNERIIHKPARKERGVIVGAYSIVTLKNGEKTREFMDIEEITEIRNRSDAYQYAVNKKSTETPWLRDEGEMCKKTVIRRHSKRLPMSTDLEAMLREDDELFMPPEQPAVPEVGEVEHSARPKRPKSLERIVVSEAAVDREPI